MRLPYQDRGQMLRACLGEIPSEFALTNAKLVNVFTGEILPATVHVFQGFVCHVDYGEEQSPNTNRIVDAGGQHLIPGLIDAHIHIESSMMTPRNFAKAVIPWGTTTVVTDPHEIGNVLGLRGLDYMYESSEDLPMRQFVHMPSCVPSVPSIEKAGANFTHEEVTAFANRTRCIGLGEVMDYLAVVHGEPRMNAILQAAEDAGLNLQGHAPGITSRELSAYLAAGPRSCHESFFGADALRKLRMGMYVDARQSSMVQNVPDIWKAVAHCKFFDTLTFCTDDREADDILRIGHMNDVINSAIATGMDPVTAIKSTTINIARQLHIDNLGAIAPGYVADMLLVPDLEKIVPQAVYFQGELVAENGKLLAEISDCTFPVEDENTIHIPTLTVDDFRIQAPIQNGTMKMNVMTYPDGHSAMTSAVVEDLPVVDGYVTLPDDDNLKFVAVINRHGHNRMSVMPLRNFGTRVGAVGSTVSHDCHNLVIVFEKPEDALLLTQTIQEMGGGMCDVLEGEVLCTLPLPIAGLLSKLPAQALAVAAAEMKRANGKLGISADDNPLLRIATLALPVIPEAKMTDAGLVDVFTQSILPAFVAD